MVAKNQTNKHTIRNLAVFTFLVITLPWFGRWLDSFMGNAPSQGIGITIWIISPLAVSFLLRAFAGDGWKDLGHLAFSVYPGYHTLHDRKFGNAYSTFSHRDNCRLYCLW